MSLFILGVVIGFLAGGIFYLLSRREITRLDEEKQLLHQENMIVLDFAHNMAEAIGEGVDLQELYERIVHAAILSTGALSGCVYEKNEENRLTGVVVEGLFPPQRPLAGEENAQLTTRAAFIEKVLRSESFEMGEGIIGSVAKSGQGLIIADATNDPRVSRHKDPSLNIRSLIVVPIHFREKNFGILAVANPSDGLAFGETDFSLVDSLGVQAGLAIHSSELMNLQIEKNKIDAL